jgi:hypothetical protein
MLHMSLLAMRSALQFGTQSNPRLCSIRQQPQALHSMHALAAQTSAQQGDAADCGVKKVTPYNALTSVSQQLLAGA